MEVAGGLVQETITVLDLPKYSTVWKCKQDTGGNFSSVMQKDDALTIYG